MFCAYRAAFCTQTGFHSAYHGEKWPGEGSSLVHCWYTAVNQKSYQSTILAQIRALLHIEIDEGDKDEIRCVIARLTDCDVSRDEWNDWSEWDTILDAYEDRFLWDSDFDDTEITDLPPDCADSVRQMMGIADEYYASVPPDLDDDREIVFAVKRIGMCIDGSGQSE